MAILYNAAPAFRNTFFDLLGDPLIEGKIQFSEASDHGVRRAVYKSNIIVPPALTPEAYDNPMILNLAGAASVPPIYFASNGLYFIEIFTADAVIGVDAPIQTIDNWNAPENISPTPGGDEVDITNYIANSDFTQLLRKGFDEDALGTGPTLIADPKWHFERSNTSAEVKIEFIDFVPGQTEVPDNPPRYMHFTSATSGSGETVKDVYFSINDVRSFNGNPIVIAFYARSPIASDVEVLVTQQFGSAGSSPVPTPVGAETLTSMWAQYTFTLSVPDISGKTIDPTTTGELQIRFRMKLNSTSEVDMTHFQHNRGDILLEYGYLPENYSSGRSLGIAINPSNFMRSAQVEKYLVVTDGVGNFGWESFLPAGMIIPWPTEVVPSGWLPCEADTVITASFPRLAAVLGIRYGQFFGYATVLSNVVTAISLNNGAVTDAVDVSTGFTVNVTQQGTAGLPEIFTITTTAAAGVTPGSYLTFSSALLSREWYMWVIIDGEGTDPALGGKSGIPLRLNSYDTADEGAAKIHAVMNPLSFGLPDYRGYFLRGWDHGAGRDPNSGSRDPRFDGVSGDNVGTTQDDAFESHTHSMFELSGAGDIVQGEGIEGVYTGTTGSTGGAETRPKNIYAAFIIKY